MDQKTKAEAFGGLHAGPEILILPNAWDAASAAIMEDAGAKAVATSSAAVAWAHGYPDGDTLPLPKLFSTIETVARVVKAPVGAGAVGINLEDGRRDAALHARKIVAARKAADAAGVPLFINARIDVYLKGLAEGDAAYTETVDRAAQYAAAGADGIFVPGPSDNDLIGRLAEAITLPLNIMLVSKLAPAAQLQALGVRRLSSGGGAFRAAYARLAKGVAAYLADGAPSAFANDPDGLGNLNTRFG